MFTPTIVGSGLQAYTLLTQTRDRQQTSFEGSPQVARDVANFKEKIGSINSGEELVEDRGLLRVALGAFGLDEDINNPIFIQQVLDSDLLDPDSSANRLTDPRYQALAFAFGFNSPVPPRLDASALGDGLDSIQSAEDLLADSRLLRTALERFDLEGDRNNTFFLQRVLDSDLTDPASFVNQLSDPKYLRFAEAFDFNARNQGTNRVAAFVSAFEDKISGLNRAEQLLRDPELVKAMVDVFDLSNNNPVVLERALNADPTDPNSFVNQREDKRYLALSKAFQFGLPDANLISDPEELIANTDLLQNVLDRYELSNQGADFFRSLLTSDLSDPASFANQEENSAFLGFAQDFQTKTVREGTSPAEAFVTALKDKTSTITDSSGVIFDIDVTNATLDFFGLEDRSDELTFVQKVLDSDTTVPTSFASLNPDKRLTALANAFGFNTTTTTREFPQGFADEIARRYTERQFDIAVGEFDPNLRLALSVEREMESVLSRGGVNDSLWLRVIGSPPLRQVFETAFQLPSAFVNADVTQQLDVLKERSQAIFGTDSFRDLTTPEQIDDLRRRFLVFSELAAGQSTGGGASAQSVALAIIGGAG